MSPRWLLPALGVALLACSFDSSRLDALRTCRSQLDCATAARPYCVASYCVADPRVVLDAGLDTSGPPVRDAGRDVEAVDAFDAGPPPQATVQLTESGLLGDTVALNATQSTGQGLAYGWEVEAPNGDAVDVEVAEEGLASFRPLRQGTYLATAVVTDAWGRQVRSARLELEVPGFEALALPTGGGANDVSTVDGTRVWVATDDGPLRLDRAGVGPTWLLYNEVALPTAWVVLDPWYAWYGRPEGGALRARREHELDDPRRAVQQSLSGVGRLLAVSAAPSGVVWFGGTTGLRRTRSVDTGSLGPMLQIAGQREMRALAAQDTGVWVGRTSGVCFAETSEGTELDCPVQPVVADPDGQVVPDLIASLAVDTSGDLWVGTDGQGLFRVRGEEVEAFAPGSRGLPPGPILVSDLAADPEGDVWAVVDGALVRIYAGSGRVVVLGDGSGLAPTGALVAVLVTTAPRQVWVAGEHGVAVMGG